MDAARPVSKRHAAMDAVLAHLADSGERTTGMIARETGLDRGVVHAALINLLRSGGAQRVPGTFPQLWKAVTENDSVEKREDTLSAG